ncbi:hypothetical protein QWZ06_10850 [Chryseobacterium tructae]|uniref:Ig-like domain-containing protein n=1 Tax=Chryseobacterium tructae TaxID=1037380 RepID=A0ABV7XZ48_9FLAO|nr:hypothetical protein [Chryseobacterium tructae]MDN3692741.1 hypothetical protein [Chryseobacterium tructae]
MKYFIKILASITLLLGAECKIYAADYYWVGGSGNWSDINHWRISSGGNILPAVVPGKTDNVFFDVNSGFTSGSKTVTVNVVANCHNIIFSGSTVAPTIISSTGTNALNIYGSSEWQNGMSHKITTTNYQNNNEHRTIKSNGVVIGDNTWSGTVNFYETQSISLLDDFNVKYILNQYAGTWNTNGFRVDLGSDFASQSNAQKTINLSNSHIYLNGVISSFNTKAANTVFNSGTSVIHFTAQVTNSSPSYGIQGSAGQIYYDVIFENPLSTGTAIGTGGTLSGSLNFHHVELKGGGYIYGFNRYNQLILAPAKTFYLESNTNQTINSLFSLDTPACEGWSTIKSMSDGSAANISMPSGSLVQVSGVVMKDIKASGGANFIASNSINNGNTSGWIFPSYTGQTLYWVGGSGNWNDKLHWSQASGGVGGYCVPGPGDNVFFDGGSGFTSGSKTITLDNVSYCHNIIFSGSTVAPTIISSTGTNALNIYGSSEWQSGMSHKITTTNYQNNNEQRTIKSNGVITGDSGSSGAVNFYETQSISLLDDFNVRYSLNQYAGTWNTNGFRVDLGSDFLSQSSSQKTIYLSNSHIYLNGIISSFNTKAANTVFNSGTSVIHFTAQVTNSSPSYGIQGSAGQTYYDVIFENPLSTGTAIGTGGTSASSLNFHHVELKGGGYIYGFNRYNQLILAPAKTFYLESNTNQTINSLFSLNTPECEGWSTIKSMSDGSAANISMPSSSLVQVSGVVMKDIKASGGASFIASNSINNGNTSGWIFPSYTGQTLYWVGGSGNWNDKLHWSQTSGGVGGYCVPGPGDNVFFDGGSGFTSGSKTITLDNVSYCHNIIFSGSAVAPTILSSTATNTLNIYGSSEWQKGMSHKITTTNYQNNNEHRTIKSNGVVIGDNTWSGTVNFYETQSISLLDDFNVKYILNQYAGTWNTNGFRVDLGSDFASQSNAQKTINLSNSHIYLNGVISSFNTKAANTILNSGTSVIHFTAQIINSSSSYGIQGFAGQTYYDVIFENSLSTGTAIGTGGTSASSLNFHHVELKGGGYMYGFNKYDQLILTAGKSYVFEAGSTQTIISKLYASGNPCYIIYLLSSASGIRANLNVQGGSLNFDFGNIKDINAVQPLHYGEKSTNAGNNMNFVFEPYNPGSFEGLGNDWNCHEYDNTNVNSYTLSADSFFPGPSTTLQWTKIDDPNHVEILSNGSKIDLRPYGYGIYQLDVTYSTAGSPDYCTVTEQIAINRKIGVPSINTIKVCKKKSNTLADIIVSGQNIKWYKDETSLSVLPLTTIITDGQTYYVTQTDNNCESNRYLYTVQITNCQSQSMINPVLPFRTK